MVGLAMRDQNSIAVAKEFTGREAELVCDPVILYGYEEEIAKHTNPNLPKYLLVYAYESRLNAYDNVEVYFFPDREDIILDLNHYADYSHYHPDYNRFMTECFADGTTGLVTKEGVAGAAAEESTGKGKTIDEYLEHMRGRSSRTDLTFWSTTRASTSWRPRRRCRWRSGRRSSVSI